MGLGGAGWVKNFIGVFAMGPHRLCILVFFLDYRSNLAFGIFILTKSEGYSFDVVSVSIPSQTLFVRFYAFLVRMITMEHDFSVLENKHNKVIPLTHW